jgi:hypothetical protein
VGSVKAGVRSDPVIYQIPLSLRERARVRVGQ